MIIFVLGVPHSGADWAAQVAAEILAAHDRPCQIVEALESGQAADDALAQHLSAAGTEGDALVLRTATATPAMAGLSHQPNCRAVMTYRDPRDVVASLMAKDGLPFDAALAATAEAFRLFREVFGLAHLTLLPYAHQVASPEIMANQIALAMNTLLDRGTVQRIAAHAAEVVPSKPLGPGSWETSLDAANRAAVAEIFQDIVDLIGSDDTGDGDPVL